MIDTAPFLHCVDSLLDRARRKLSALSVPGFIAASVLLCLIVSITVMSPRLYMLFDEPSAGRFEWARALNFIKQVEDPLDAEVEPALRWRLAPALLGHALNLQGYSALVVPWIGLFAALSYAAALSAARMRDRLDALLLVVLIGTLAAVQSVTMAHGINDGWLLLALLATAFSGSTTLRAVAAFVGPWVDERYLFALPLCLVCRAIFPPPGAIPVSVWRFAPWEVAGAALYVGARLIFTLQEGDPVSGSFVQQALSIVPKYLPHGPLGWWMGQRAAWILVAFAIIAAASSHGRKAVIGIGMTALFGFGAITLLAADLTRSTNFFLPLTCAGAFAADQIVGAHRTRFLAAVLALNLILPFAMLTYQWIVPIYPLPYELLLLYRHW